MLWDFKKINYTARLRYFYIVLCMLFQPFVFIYLLCSRNERKAAEKRTFLTPWTFPLLFVCLVWWYQLFISYPLMLKNTYTRAQESKTESTDIQNAKQFLKNAGMNEYDTLLLDEQSMLYLNEQLDDTAVLLAKVSADTCGQNDIVASLLLNTLPKHEITCWLFQTGSNETTGREIYAVVTCIEWTDNTALQQGEFAISLPDGFEMEGRNGFFRIWAKGGSKIYYRDEAFSKISFDMNAFHFYGKSIWKKYSYQACAVTYITGTQPPEYVTLTLSQQKNSISGQHQVVYSANYRFRRSDDQTVAVDGVTRIDTEAGKGIMLDLDGDGAAERLFVSEEGIYINDELAADLWAYRSGSKNQGWDFYWITDIDTSDQYYNLIFNSGDDASKSQIMAWYDGSLHVEKLSNFNGDAFSAAEYHGDGTFIVPSYPVPLPYQSCYRPVEFRWSAETGLERIPNEVELDESCTWTLLAGLNLYQSADFESETVTIGAQEVQLKEILFDDSYTYCWIHLSGLDDGTEGWIYTEYIENQWIVNCDKDAQEIFEGFSTAG